MWGRSKDTDVEHGFVDTVREGEGGMNGKSSINMYTLSCVRWIAGGTLLYNTGASLVFCDDLQGWGWVRGRRLKREVIYV